MKIKKGISPLSSKSESPSVKIKFPKKIFPVINKRKRETPPKKKPRIFYNSTIDVDACLGIRKTRKKIKNTKSIPNIHTHLLRIESSTQLTNRSSAAPSPQILTKR